MSEKFRPLDGPLKPGDPCYPNPGPMFGGGIGSMGWTGWLKRDVPLKESRKDEAERLQPIRKALAAVVRFFYHGEEPEEPDRDDRPGWMIPGTFPNRMWRIQQGLPDENPLSSTEEVRNPEGAQRIFRREAASF